MDRIKNHASYPVILEASRGYLYTLAEGETGWRETLQSGDPKYLRVGWPFPLH